jgi:hypothetical protein
MLLFALEAAEVTTGPLSPQKVMAVPIVARSPRWSGPSSTALMPQRTCKTDRDCSG